MWDLVPNGRVRSAEPRWSRSTPGGFLGIAFTPDGSRVVGITQEQQPSETGPQGQTVPAAPAPMAHVIVWDAATGKEMLTFEAPGGKELRIFKDAAGKEVMPYETPAGLQRTLAIAPDGRTLYALSQAGRMSVIDLATGKERFGFTAFAPAAGGGPAPPMIDGLVVTADGRNLIAVQSQTAVAGFDARTGKELWQCRDRDMYWCSSLGVLPGGNQFLIGHNDGALLICDGELEKCSTNNRATAASCRP